MPHATEFSAYAVKRGKEARADEWMNTLVARQHECVATLDREAMHFESLFKAQINGRTYLAWYSVQSPAGQSVRGSPHPVDTLHLAFWDECIDRSVPPIDFSHIVNFVPASVAEAISARERTLQA